jgi:drug/metabolite transporter (DMT)-like permease
MGLNNLLWFILLASLWGPSFLFIKVAVAEIPPITLVAWRVGLGALLLYLYLRSQGRALPRPGPVWKSFAVVGFFGNAIPFVLIAWGEQRIDSSLTSILNGATPLFTIILAHFLVADDRLTPIKGVGTLLGFGGLLVLFAPSLLAGAQATTWGLLAVTIATISYGISMVYARIRLRGLPPLVVPTAQLMMATLYLFPLSLLVDRSYGLALPSWEALGAMAGLSLLGTALGFAVFYHLLENVEPTYVSMITYLLPVVAIILGMVVLKERLAWNAYVGCALILLGIMIANGVFQQRVKSHTLTLALSQEEREDEEFSG